MVGEATFVFAFASRPGRISTRLCFEALVLAASWRAGLGGQGNPASQHGKIAVPTGKPSERGEGAEYAKIKKMM